MVYLSNATILTSQIILWDLKNQLSYSTFCPRPGSGFLSGFRFLYFWWSYLKNSNASQFVLTYQFIHSNFRLVRGPFFCLASGFYTLVGGRIEIIKVEKLFLTYWIQIFLIYCEVIVWKGFSGLNSLKKGNLFYFLLHSLMPITVFLIV